MPFDPAHLDALDSLLTTVRLRLERSGDTFAVGYERETHPLSTLPVDDLDPRCLSAELIAVAAGLEAAVKYPDALGKGETLREGAAPLLPRVERARFARAYDAVIDGRGHGSEYRLFTRDLGADLVTAYVHDGGWSFVYLCQGHIASWGAGADTVHSIARSNLYARAELDHRATSIAVGDGYDAARAVILDDVFYDRAGADGITVAIPGREQLFIGPDIDGDAVAAAYAASTYPLTPDVLVASGHRLRRRSA